MLNLLISGNDEAFRGEPWTLDRDRVFEHTHEAVAAPYRDLSREQIEQLCRFPALVGFEKGVRRNARIARIDQVRLRHKELRVEYTFVPGLPEITPEQLEALSWQLDIGKLELHRTHWALKDVNILEEMSSIGILPPGERARIHADFQELFGMAKQSKPVVVNPTIFRVPDQQVELDLVSVMIPFSAAFTPVFQKLRQVGEGIGLRVINANQIWEESEIIHDIFSLIYRSSVVICDFSEKNPNVFYEAGIAHTLGKPVIPLVQRVDDIPFDLRHHRHIVYLNNEEGRDGLGRELLPRLQTLVQRGR